MLQVIGMGPGNIKNLTIEAIEKILNADEVIAFGRISQTPLKTKRPISVISKVNDVKKLISKDKDIAILASGDPCFYGIVEYLKKNEIQIDNIIPGLSSFQYMMAKLKKSWHDASFLSLHGRDASLENVKNNKITVILTDKDNTASKISKDLMKLGVKGKLYAGFNLSYEDEEIITVNIGEEVNKDESLCIVIVEKAYD